VWVRRLVLAEGKGEEKGRGRKELCSPFTRSLRPSPCGRGEGGKGRNAQPYFARLFNKEGGKKEKKGGKRGPEDSAFFTPEDRRAFFLFRRKGKRKGSVLAFTVHARVRCEADADRDGGGGKKKKKRGGRGRKENGMGMSSLHLLLAF